MSEWVRLLLALRPDLTEPEGRAVTQAVLGIVHDSAREPQLRRRTNLGADLTSIGLRVLLDSGSP